MTRSSAQPGPDDAAAPGALDGEIERFTVWAALQRGYAENTLQSYLRDLNAFSRFLAGCGLRGAAAVERSHIRDFLEHSRTKGGLAAVSLGRRLVSVKILFRWLVREGLLAKDPASVLQGPRLGRSLPEMISVEEVGKLLDVWKDAKEPLERRNRTMLELFYASGLRVSELAELRLNGLNFEDGMVRVLGKGSKERVVPMGRPAQEALKSYLKEVRPALDKTGAAPQVFLSKSGRALTRAMVWNIVRLAARLAGITKTVYPHLLRHSFASHLLAGGADLRVIQEMLGHADIGTTQIYTHVEDDRLAAVHRQFHPRG